MAMIYLNLSKKINVLRFLIIHSFKFILDIFNSEIQKIKLQIPQFKNIKYIFKEYIGKAMLENSFAQTLETILYNPISKNEINTAIGIEEDHNKKNIKQLKEINDSSINKLINMGFCVIFYIYTFGNEELKYNNKNL